MADVGGIQLHYITLGDGEPVLILHGWAGDAASMAHDYEPAFSASPGWRRIYLDLPGRGGSPATSAAVSAGDLLGLIMRFVDDVIGLSSFSVIGASYGGLFASAIARQFPDRLTGMCLIAPQVRVDGGTDLPERTVIVANAIDISTLPDGWEWIPEVLVVQTPEVVGAFTATVEAMTAPPDEEYLALSGAADNNRFPFDVADSPVQCSAPVLCVVGRQDNMVGYRDAWGFAEQFPRASFAVLDRAGHAVPWEQPTLLHALVQDWLFRVREYVS